MDRNLCVCSSCSSTTPLRLICSESVAVLVYILLVYILLVYVTFDLAERNNFSEDILGITALTTHTRGEDIYLAIQDMLPQRGMSMKDVVSITTDGAPSMISLHYPSLCSALLEENEEVMNTSSTFSGHRHHINTPPWRTPDRS